MGGATHTSAGKLKCKYIIHAVGPIWEGVSLFVLSWWVTNESFNVIGKFERRATFSWRYNFKVVVIHRLLGINIFPKFRTAILLPYFFAADLIFPSLKEADQKIGVIESISFPAISSGIFGFPKDLCAKIFFDTIKA